MNSERTREPDSAKEVVFSANGKISELPQVTELPVAERMGVTFARACQLAKLKIHTIGDAFFYTPSRYEDRRDIRQIGMLKKGESALVLGEVIGVKIKRFRSSRKFVCEVLIKDESGELYCQWWNQTWPADVFRRADKAILFGKVTRGGAKIQFVVQEYEILRDDRDIRLSTGRIVPVYPLTEGMTQRWLRGFISGVLKRFLQDLPEGEKYDEKWGFPGRREAIEQLHYPSLPGNEERARQRLAMDELLEMQLEIQKRRQRLRQLAHGITCPGDNHLIKPFLRELPFTLTQGQMEVLREIRADFNSGIPMRRLLQGDVGSGKTVTAACCALMLIEGDYNVVLMAPTEVLASQHARTFRKWFDPLGVPVRLWTGRIKQEEDLLSLATETHHTGKSGIVIGTHALIENTFQIDRLGLVIIDEQHKFGVEQRERLLKKGSRPHLLVMTATPIPRTLGLTVYGELDTSCIRQMPQGRGTVRTFLRNRDKSEEIWNFAKSQLKKGRQIYVIYPLIDESSKPDIRAVEKEFLSISARIAPYKAGLLHGRMKGEEKDYIMSQFAGNQVQVLVSTSVVEVGVDVPNATVMIIENAECFGLAQLHQLRGRIGRGKENSYCILLMGIDKEESWRRLKILEESRDGFRIAEEDLKQRGPGDFLGERQHGAPMFRFANLIYDYNLIQEARKLALAKVNSTGIFNGENEGIGYE